MNISSSTSNRVMTRLTAGLFALILLCSLAVAFSSPGRTSALSGSDFKPGRIIDDSVFYNSNSMSASQIQNFLNSKLPDCDTDGSESYSYYYRASPLRLNDDRDTWVTTTRAVYGQRVYQRDGSWRGSRAPYTCLKDYRQNTSNIAPDSGLCGGYTGASNESAATIIYKVAQSCGVNPQTILVTLQKEQSLITDDWPWGQQYNKAMGMNCPDSELDPEDDTNGNGCEDWSEGFFRQVYYGTRQFKVYKANQANYNYRAGRNNTILWNPNTSCGTSNVYIENQATAALYIYTPYRPNPAALNNLYGTGDGCSSYGVRNFWRMFNDWFGPTIDTPLFRIGNDPAVYILGSENNYYHVPNQTILKAYGYGTSVSKIKQVSSGYVSGRTLSGRLPLVARFEGSAVYLMSKGKAHHVTSQTILNAYGYTIGQEAYLRSFDKSYLQDDANVQTIARNADGPQVWLVEDGKKRHIINSEAYDTLGSPTYSSRPTVSLDENVMATLADGMPVLTPNKILNRLGTDTYAFWDGTERQDISSSTVSELGMIVSYRGSSDSIDQLPNSATNINKLVKDDGGNLFILDSNKRLLVSPSDLSETGLNSNSFTLVSDGFLDSLAQEDFSRAVRIGNDAAVYLVTGGKLRHVHHRTALEERGFTMDQVTSVIQTSADVFPAGTKILPLGTLFKLNSSDRVRIINGLGSSLYVPSRNILPDFGLSMDAVMTVTSGTASGYPETSRLENFIKNSSDGTTWFFEGGVKRPVTSQMRAANKYNIDTNSLAVFDPTLLGYYTTGSNLTEVIRSDSSPKVYEIVSGARRWVTSQAALSARGFSAGSITPVSEYFVNTLPLGANINN